MANTIRVKRSTTTSAPTTLQNAELAYSESSNKLFIGVGTGGVGGSATSVVAIGGTGAFLDLTTAASTYQTISGMSSYLTTSAASSTYLTQASASSTYQTISGMSSYLTTASASSTYAPLASPSFTGIPTVPTAVAGTNTTQAASTAFVTTAVSNLVNGAGAALDTLKELADALGNDASFSTTIATSLGEKLVKTANLSDLTSASSARVNLGLGTIATQNANNVAITGGTIDNITFDGGTF